MTDDTLVFMNQSKKNLRFDIQRYLLTQFKEVSAVPMMELEALRRNGSKAEILGREIWSVKQEPTESSLLLEQLKAGEACVENASEEKQDEE